MVCRAPGRGRFTPWVKNLSLVLLVLTPVIFLDACLEQGRDSSGLPPGIGQGSVSSGKPPPPVSRRMSIMPRRHPDDRPYGVAVLSSLGEAGTIRVLGELHRGLTGLGWLPPPSPEYGMIGHIDQERQYWAGLASDESCSLVFLPGLLGMTEGSSPRSPQWWKSLEKGRIGVDAVIFLGHEALLSYRYQENSLNLPVFHYSPVAGETWFLAASFPPSRQTVPLMPGFGLHTDLGDFMELLDGGPVMVAGDFDSLEKVALAEFIGVLDTVYGGRARLADGTWISRDPEDPERQDFALDPRHRGILVATRLPEALENRLADLSVSGNIPVFCASGIGGRLRSMALAWREDFPQAELEKTMALNLVEAFTGYPGQAGLGGGLPGLGLDMQKLRQAGLRLAAKDILALPFRGGKKP